MDHYHRRKFRSQTSGNVDRWNSRGAKSQRREEKKKEDQTRERVRGKKMQVREKVEMSRFTVFFQWFLAPEGRKVGSLKRRVRSHLARWEMKNCTLLWRQTHFEVKSVKNWRSRTTFRSWDVEKADGVVEVEMLKKCTPSWREALFQVRMSKAPHVRTTFGRSDVVSRGRHKGLCTLSKASKTWGFCSSFKSGGRRGTFEDHLQRCIFRGKRRTKDMFIRDVRRSADFLRGVAFWSIRSSVLGRWFCVTGAALRMAWPHFLLAGAIL